MIDGSRWLSSSRGLFCCCGGGAVEEGSLLHVQPATLESVQGEIRTPEGDRGVGKRPVSLLIVASNLYYFRRYAVVVAAGGEIIVEF